MVRKALLSHPGEPFFEVSVLTRGRRALDLGLPGATQRSAKNTQNAADRLLPRFYPFQQDLLLPGLDRELYIQTLETAHQGVRRVKTMDHPSTVRSASVVTRL
jgi:hypothetical protein